MKPDAFRTVEHNLLVASPADAWIETLALRKSSAWSRVASPADAWIETLGVIGVQGNLMSRPPRTRGLKRPYCLSCVIYGLSRPPRTRGLKHVLLIVSSSYFTSRPPRTRGLKPAQVAQLLRALCVASPADAWIETIGDRPIRPLPIRRVPRGRVD